MWKQNQSDNSSLKATFTEGAPMAALERAQADYLAARTGFRKRQRQILQDVFRSVKDLLDKDKGNEFLERFGKFAGDDGDRPTDTDRLWFHAIAYVYQATSRSARKKASKHASALRFLYEQDLDADKIAAHIEKGGGIQKLADEAAKTRRRKSKQGEGEDHAVRKADGSEEEAEACDAGEDKDVRFDISDELSAKIRGWRGRRVKIIARVSEKARHVEVLKIVKLKD